MEMYRSILLSDYIGKLSSRARRTANTPHFEQELAAEYAWQCGGVPGLGTEFPAVAIRMLQAYAKVSHTSTALLNVNAKQAFHSIIRQLVVAVSESDEAVAHLFTRLQIPPDVLHKLRERLNDSAFRHRRCHGT